jgi:CelD/BcsL family acetyltransferase involved in cellulose biosynthesis
METKYRLKFRVGEFTLLSVPLALENRLHAAIDLSSSPEAFASEMPSDGDGLLFKAAEITGEAPSLVTGQRCMRYVPYRFRRFILDLTGDYDAYLQKFSSKSRSTLKRKVRKFETLSGGTIDWRIYRSPAEMEEFFRLARALSSKTYQERLLDAGLPSDAGFEVHLRNRAEQGTALGFLLFLDGKAISYLYSPIDDDVVAYAYLGYDQEFSQHSPGTVLQLLAVEWLFEQGQYRAFDFGEGEGDHKAFFSTRHVQSADVFILKRTAGLRLLVSLHRTTLGASDAVTNFLDRIGLKKKIKQFIRRRAAQA